MLVGRCHSELSGRKHEKSQSPSEAGLSRRAAKRSALPRPFPGVFSNRLRNTYVSLRLTWEWTAFLPWDLAECLL